MEGQIKKHFLFSVELLARLVSDNKTFILKTLYLTVLSTISTCCKCICIYVTKIWIILFCCVMLLLMTLVGDLMAQVPVVELGLSTAF